MTKSGRLVIICGLPGSGKTTLAVQLENDMSAVRLSADDWMNALSINLHAEESRNNIEAVQWQLAKRLLTLGQTVIVEWGAWCKSDRSRLRTEARALGATVELHYLAVPLEELFDRIRRRGAEDPPITLDALQEWERLFEPRSPEEFNLFDAPLLESPRARGVTADPAGLYKIRRFETGDRDAIQNIRKRAFESIYVSWRELLGEAIFDIEDGDADQRQAEYLDLICQEHSEKEVYVLLCKSRIVGFIGISMEEHRRKGEIDLNAVDPDFQGQGAGTHLYNFALARLGERGLNLAKVGTGLDAAHGPALRAYRKAGFTVGIPGITMFRLLSPRQPER
jgi:predicted kinase/ribosomal protein S18 acetylase RimI-like enzyme